MGGSRLGLADKADIFILGENEPSGHILI